MFKAIGGGESGNEGEFCLRPTYQSPGTKQLWWFNARPKCPNRGMSYGVRDVEARRKSLFQIAGKNKHWVKGQTCFKVKKRAVELTLPLDTCDMCQKSEATFGIQ